MMDGFTGRKNVDIRELVKQNNLIRLDDDKTGTFSIVYIGENLILKEQWLYKIGDEWHSMQLFINEPSYDNLIKKIEKIYTGDFSDPFTNFNILKSLCGGSWEKEVKAMRVASDNGITPLFIDAWIEPHTLRLAKGYIMQEKASIILSDYTEVDLLKRLSMLGHGAITGLLKKVATCRLCHVDLNPGNLVIYRDKLMLIDWGDTYHNSGVRYSIHKLKEASQLENMWRYISMLHNFVKIWTKSTIDTDFMLAVIIPINALIVKIIDDVHHYNEDKHLVHDTVDFIQKAKNSSPPYTRC